jgi:hypothetical protein
MNLSMFFSSPISLSIVSTASLAPPWAGPHRAAMPGRDAGEGIGAGRSRQTHRRGGGILLVVGVQQEDAVHGLGDHRIDVVVLARVPNIM